MRVGFSSVAEFLSELHQESSRIFENTVRVLIDAMPEQDECVTFRYGIWLTAIVKMEDGEVLLECGVSTGSEDAGQAAAEQLRHQVVSECGELGLKVRPGKIEAF